MILNINKKEFEIINIINKRRKRGNICFKRKMANVIVVETTKKYREKEFEKLVFDNIKILNKLASKELVEIEEGEMLIFGIKYKNASDDLIKDAFQKVVDIFYRIQKDNNYPESTLKFQKMRSRWGVCFPFKNTIKLTTHIISLPTELIEYIIYHEFSHYKVKNHSRLFYNEMDKCFPGHRTARKKLQFYNTILK